MCILAIILLIGCEDKNKNQTNSNNRVEKKEEAFDTEYKNADFRDTTDFYLEDNKKENIETQRILLQNRDTVQLDIELKDIKSNISNENNAIATLIIKKSKSYSLVEDEENIITYNIDGVVVTLVKSLDGINRYYWDKDNFNYILSSKSDFSSDDLKKIIQKYVAVVSGDLYK